MISKGTHKARGVEGALGMTGTGKEQVAVLLEILEGEHMGEQITWYGYFTEKTVDRTMQSLRYLGWETDDLSDLAGIGSNEVRVVIEHEEDQQGEMRARVKWINGGGGIGLKDKMDDNAARAFAARMKGAAIASRSAQPRNGGKSGSGNRFDGPPPPDDSDLPF